MKPVKKHQGIIEGIHLEIAESKTHLSIIQMEHLIEGLNADPKSRMMRKVFSMSSSLLRQRFMVFHEMMYTFTNFLTSIPLSM